MQSGRRSSLWWWIGGSGLVLLLCGLAPQRTMLADDSTIDSPSFIGARVQCAGMTEVFLHERDLRPAIVPFSATVFDFGGFNLADGRIEVPADGVYIVEANVTIRFRDAVGPLKPSIRMIVRSDAAVVAAATGTRASEEAAATCLSATTTCELKKGAHVFVELATNDLHDDPAKNPVVTGESEANVCHLSIARLGQVPANRK